MAAPNTRPKVLVNALHTTGGGGLVYLNNLLPRVATDGRFVLEILVSPASAAVVQAPPGVRVRVAPAWVRGWRVHVYEQLCAPVLARLWGARVVWSNANYGPILAPRPVPTLHTTSRAAAAWPGVFWKMYWGALRGLTWLSVVRAPVVLAVAAHVAQEYPWSCATRKLQVAYPAVQVPVLHVPKAAVPTVAVVADFYAHKRLPLVVRAFALLREKLPAARLVLVGRPVWPQVVQAVEAEITAQGLGSAVEIIPGLPHAALLAKVAECHVLTTASMAECFNMPLVEAMALGVPVVCSDDDFNTEVVGEVVGAGASAAAVRVNLRAGDSAAALAVALFGVLMNSSIAATLTKRGLAQAAQFTWARAAEKVRAGLAQALKMT